VDAEASGLYEKSRLRNTILKGRSVGVAAYTAKEALEWGTTGAGLRATGIGFDVRKWRPYLAMKTSTSKSRPGRL
jgi:NADH:ubiquinone oxidoreductase subunit D